MLGSFRSKFELISSLFYVFATQSRFLSAFHLRIIKELFDQSSFYLKNSVSSVQLLFKKSYLHFSPGKESGGNVRRGNVLDIFQECLSKELSEILFRNNVSRFFSFFLSPSASRLC